MNSIISIKKFDFVSTIIVSFLVIIGLINIYSSTYFDNMSFDPSFFVKAILEPCVKLINVGRSVNVVKRDVINPKVIIQPKSIMGFISLKIKDINAHIVVITV